MKAKLSGGPARPLSSLEAAQVISGVLMGLCEFCDVGTVRIAVRYLADEESVWRGMQAVHEAGELLMKRPR